MIKQSPVIMGIDGGGSHTRAMIVDGAGQVLAYAEAGGANPYRNMDAKANLQQVVDTTLDIAGLKREDLAHFVAGIAGIDKEDDYKWARDFVQLEGLACTPKVVTDALIAQIGAFHGEPGIIAISGTGSIIFGVNEAGEQLSNYDFIHYAASGARSLAYKTVHRIIAGQYSETDLPLVQSILQYWEVDDIQQLARLGASGFIEDPHERNRKFGSMAPLITSAADNQIPLAEQVCHSALDEITTGIMMLGACYERTNIEIALIGSVLRSPYMLQMMEKNLSSTHFTEGKKYFLTHPLCSPVAGAVLLGYKELGLEVGDTVLQKLLSHPHAKF
ncbi:BadF/BadG/BcrA/BcrD ATPase family protein [Paenibacillus sediminis]|uniref:Glucosamine kinase n=1 Tax=Paenibacillus sediminis TaxID=664909 RepID=A0ABS4H302_9BACL|nr:BadF/BadG/BcrA/BcrD ATPase family protein [Paenibacillus sediminis]MBP1936505.1 glucosamine kinase [Paenibacillus sediminis]